MTDIHWETANNWSGPTWTCLQCGTRAAGNLDQIQQQAIYHECPERDRSVTSSA